MELRHDIYLPQGMTWEECIWKHIDATTYFSMFGDKVKNCQFFGIHRAVMK